MLVLALAYLAGAFLWQSYGPAEEPKYQLRYEGDAIAGADETAKNVYLRHTLKLTRRPSRAWLEVYTRDEVMLYVNDQIVGQRIADGFAQSIVIDLAPFLREGTNVIALHLEQFVGDRPPQVAVRGGYEIAGQSHTIDASGDWRSNSTFARNGYWWFEEKFDDSMWVAARRTKAIYNGETPIPPRAITEPTLGKWISPDGTNANGVACLRRSFVMHDLPREGWLRLTTNCAYRVALNGAVFDEQESRLGTSQLAAPFERTYDISPLLERGQNTLSVWLTSPTTAPHLLADLETTDIAGERVRSGSDSSWRAARGLPEDWRTVAKDERLGAAWKPAVLEVGNLGMASWQIGRETVAILLPASVTLPRFFLRTALTLGLAGLIGLVTWLAAQWLGNHSSPAQVRRGDVAYLALILPSIALFVAALVATDPRVPPELIYRSQLLPIALATIPVQWLLLSLFRGVGAGLFRDSRHMLWPRYTAALAAGALMGLGLMLRLEGYLARELGADEVHMYRCTMGCLERGFPSYIVTEDLPVQWVATSALVYIGPTITAIFTDDPCTIIRLPAVIWGVLTIGLLFITGRRMYSSSVGLIAAAIYAISPICITMANFGRYPSQLQFVTLLTIYCFWRAVENRTTLNRLFLWLTAISFIAVFLSWQAAAFLAIGLTICVLLDRRGDLKPVFGCGTVWQAAGVVFLVILAQSAQRALSQSGRLDYGMGASEVSLTPMWTFPQFDPVRFVHQAAWSSSDLLPLLAIVVSFVLTLKSAWRRPTQMLIIIFLTTALLMALLLPVTAGRYAYLLSTIAILLTTVSIVSVARQLQDLVRHAPTPKVWRAYASCVAAILVLAGAALATELTAQLSKLRALTKDSDRPGVLSARSLSGPSHFLVKHMQPGDVVLSTQPYLVAHHAWLGSGKSTRLDPENFHWLQTRLHLQAVLDDGRSVPLNRRDGTPVIATEESLKDLFNKHARVWYVVAKGHHNRLNVNSVSSFLRQHMLVAYEDVDSLVLLKDDTQHRPASLRIRDEQALEAAESNFLP